MALYKINEYDPNYRHNSNNLLVRNFSVYSDRNEKVGAVVDALLDQTGNLRYLVVELSHWAAGKQILVPIGRSQVDLARQCIVLKGLSAQQAATLPAYQGNVDYQQEEQVRQVYRMRSLEESAPLEASVPLEGYRMPPAIHSPAPAPVPSQPTVPPIMPPTTPPREIASAVPYTSETYDYQQDADLYTVNEREHQPFWQYQEQLRTLRQQQQPPVPAPDVVSHPTSHPASNTVEEEVIPLREERLIVDRKKRKTGEVIIRKEIETEIVEVPVQREKLIVEQVGPEPKQLAEIDLTDNQDVDDVLSKRRRVELPNLPKADPASEHHRDW